MRQLIAIALTCTGAAISGAAQSADTYINATVTGVLAPGVYGQINIGNAPPPVINRQPIIIAQPAVVVGMQPIYLYAPPGHIKHWSKHCAAYNACNRPVYFVNVDSHGRYVQGEQFQEHGRGDDDHPGKGHGKGHGKEH